MSRRIHLDHHNARTSDQAKIQKLYELIGAREDDHFLLTSGSEEAAMQVLHSHYFDTVRQTGRNHVLTSQVEDAPILTGIHQFEKGDLLCKKVPVNNKGQLTKEMLEQAINPRTSLLALSWANKLTGVIHPILDLADLCRQKGIKVYVDASEVVGKLYFRFQDLQVDALSCEGALFLRKETAFLLQSRPFYGLASFVEEWEAKCHQFDHLCTETARLKSKLEQGIVLGVPGSFVFFDESDRLPHCTAICFPGIVGEALLYALHQKGVYASIGGGRLHKLSQVLIACGVENALAHAAVSFSLSYETTEEEIDRAIEAIVAAAKELRKYSEALL